MEEKAFRISDCGLESSVARLGAGSSRKKSFAKKPAAVFSLDFLLLTEYVKKVTHVLHPGHKIHNPGKCAALQERLECVPFSEQGGEGVYQWTIMMSPDENQNIKNLIHRHAEALMKLPGVVGVGQGLHENMPCIQVFLKEDSPAVKKKIPNSLDGVPVVTQVTGMFRTSAL